VSALNEEIERARNCLDRASKIVLDEFVLRIDVKKTVYLERQHDEHGKQMLGYNP
jgi:hypothetical protein